MKNSKEQKAFELGEVREDHLKHDSPRFPCKFHRYAKEEDLVDTVIKKTGEIVKRCRYCEREKYENKKIRSEDWKKEKDNVTDYYVRRTLAIGKNSLGMHEYPDELVQAKQAVIKLKRAVQKANEPLRTCSQHGKLFRDDVIKNGKRRNGDIVWKCRKCMKEMHAKHYELNRAKVLAKHKEYRDTNRDKVAMQKKRSRDKNKFKYLSACTLSNAAFRHKIEREKTLKRKRDQKEVADLTDNYIKRKLKYKSGLKNEDIPQSLVEAKRAILMLKRGIRKKRDEEVFNYLEELDSGKDKKH